MIHELGDRVRIIATGQIGSVCDIHTVDGQRLYVVDCSGECNSELLTDCAITVAEHEIETHITEEA